MRPTLMHLSAAGILLVGLVILIRQPGPTEGLAMSSVMSRRNSSERNTATQDPSSPSQPNAGPALMPEAKTPVPQPDDFSPQHSVAKPGPRTSPGASPRTTPLESNDSKHQASDSVSGNEIPGMADDVLVEIPLPAVRLADDVQLPAVILTLNEERADPANLTPQPIKDAMNSIVDTFYQDLAKAAVQGEHVGQDPDGTYVIGKGSAVDRARDRANEIYRALFGDDAYNRMSMNAVLESQLPTPE